MKPLPVASRHAEWVEFLDPHDEGWTWRFEVSYLLSTHSCIYGRGCPGTQLDGNGCCSDGAYLDGGYYVGDDADEDFSLVDAAVGRLRPDQWQFHGYAERHGWWAMRGKAKHTRVHQGACIFQNREGFEGGEGCALHIAAMEAGESFLDWKPFICWLIPLQVETYADEQVTEVRHYENERDWGGHEKWWCCDSQEAYSATDEPFFRTNAAELERLCGTELWASLRAYLEKRWAQAGAHDTPVKWLGTEALDRSEVDYPDGQKPIPLAMFKPER